MILRRYGSALHSVDLNFDAKALTEIGFRKDQVRTEPAEEFLAGWERVAGHELDARAEGSVQGETEQSVLADLEARVRGLVAGLAPGEVLVVESEQGADYPKTRTQTRTVVVEGENRLRFTTTVHPPLRLAVYRQRGVSG